MSANITSNAAYVVEMKGPEGSHNPDFDSIAQGLSIKEDVTRPQKAWGTASWFDKVSGVMRMCLIQSAPVIEKGKYGILSESGESYSFLLITKSVYETTVRRMLPQIPEFSTDEEIQEYIKSLNPYE